MLLASCTEKSLPKPVLVSCFSAVSSGSFMVSVLCLSLDPFWVSFGEGCETWVQFHCSAYVSPVFLAPFVQDPILSPLGILGSLVEHYVTIQARIKFWALYSVPWVYLATLVSVHLILFYYYDFAVWFVVLSFCFFPQHCSGFSRSLWFHTI